MSKWFLSLQSKFLCLFLNRNLFTGRLRRFIQPTGTELRSADLYHFVRQWTARAQLWSANFYQLLWRSTGALVRSTDLHHFVWLWSTGALVRSTYVHLAHYCDCEWGPTGAIVRSADLCHLTHYGDSEWPHSGAKLRSANLHQRRRNWGYSHTYIICAAHAGGSGEPLLHQHHLQDQQWWWLLLYYHLNIHHSISNREKNLRIGPFQPNAESGHELMIHRRSLFSTRLRILDSKNLIIFLIVLFIYLFDMFVPQYMTYTIPNIYKMLSECYIPGRLMQT